MDPLLIVSPHADDAVLSAGQMMAGRSDCAVVTIFTGTPARTRMLTTYDRDCGFHSAGHAMRRRREEDAEACTLLRATAIHLGWLDQQYREVDVGPEPDVAAIAAQLAMVVDADPLITTVIGPLGLAHPDHLVAADALRMLLDARPLLDGWLYEDMPSRVLWPEHVPARLDRWRDAGYEPVQGFLGTGSVAVKERAVRCYASQLGALEGLDGGIHNVLVGERHHRLTRSVR